MAYVDQHRWRKTAMALAIAAGLGLGAYGLRATVGTTSAVVLGCVALLAFAYGIYKALFGNAHSFGDAIVFVLTPDALSAITGERKADDISTVVFYAWLAGVVAVGYWYFKALLA